MADNTTLSAGTADGDTFAADDIGGVKHQRVKIQHGADGSATDVSTASPLPVDSTQTIDSVVGATDKGAPALAKHKEDNVHLTSADGDYEILEVNSLGALQVAGEQHHVFDTLDATTGWAALGNDTLNLATTTIHALGSAALTFDKVDGAANTVFAGIEKTLTSVDLGTVSYHDIVQTACYVSSAADIDYSWVRLGTDASNYSEWRIAGANLTAGDLEILSFIVGDTSHAGSTGTGVDWSAITYVAIGCAFNAETDTLSGIIFDEISYHTNQHTAASLNAEVTSSVNSANVNVQKVGGSATDKNAGNVSNGTQRVVLASDQNFVHAEDSASANADAGIPAMARRTATPADTSGTDGDYEMLQMDNGRLWTSAQASGDVAHDAADSGYPVKVGAKAKAFDGTAAGTDAAENDRVDMIATVEGRQFVETAHPNYWSASADYASAQTNATVKAAPGASLKLYITDVIVSNGATAGNITLLDGSGGTVLLELYPAINGGLTHAFRTPIALTANTLLAITSTTVTTHSVTVSGFIAA